MHGRARIVPWSWTMLYKRSGSVVWSRWEFDSRRKVVVTSRAPWDRSAEPRNRIALLVRSYYDGTVTLAILSRINCALTTLLLQPEFVTTTPRLLWTYSNLATLVTITKTSILIKTSLRPNCDLHDLTHSLKFPFFHRLLFDHGLVWLRYNDLIMFILRPTCSFSLSHNLTA